MSVVVLVLSCVISVVLAQELCEILSFIGRCVTNANQVKEKEERKKI
jgi:hypothetical protein